MISLLFEEHPDPDPTLAELIDGYLARITEQEMLEPQNDEGTAEENFRH
ncbi:hypothetical protein [Haloferula sp. BvORR071]|nr:hypothetical protein [Haloferula sp. BvORR071]